MTPAGTGVAFTCPDQVSRAVEEIERRVAQLSAAARADQLTAEDVVAAVPGSGEPPD